MLTLRLKTGECLNIGEDITVRIYRHLGDSVEVAVDAPRSVKILRGKLAGPQPRSGESKTEAT